MQSTAELFLAHMQFATTETRRSTVLLMHRDRIFSTSLQGQDGHMAAKRSPAYIMTEFPIIIVGSQRPDDHRSVRSACIMVEF